MQTLHSDKLRRVVERSYVALHADHKFGAVNCEEPARPFFQVVNKIWPGKTGLTILDYGCGPNGGLLAVDDSFIRDYEITAYDPFVEQYKTPPPEPWEFDAIFTSDVLEHLTTTEILAFLDRAKTVKRLVWAFVATRPASKLLENGLNAHLTIEPAHWWFGLFQAGLGPAFRPVAARADFLHDDVTLAFERVADAVS